MPSDNSPERIHPGFQTLVESQCAVIIDAIKKQEGGNGIILRLHNTLVAESRYIIISVN